MTPSPHSSGHLLRALTLTLAGLWLGSCDSSSSSKDGGQSCQVLDGGRLNCQSMCSQYCSKLRTCGVQSGSSASCVDDCRTITEAGGSTDSYECVIRKDCKEVSDCGI